MKPCLSNYALLYRKFCKLLPSVLFSSKLWLIYFCRNICSSVFHTTKATEKIEIEICDANAKHHVDWEPRTTICGMAPELNRMYDLLDSAGLHYCSFGFIRAVNLHMKSWMKFFGHRIEVLGTLFFTHFCWRQWNWRDNTAIQTWKTPLWMITFEYMWSLLRPV